MVGGHTKMNKAVLISGGAGFLGSHLCDYYIAKKYKVVCVDNFSTGNKSNIKKLLCNAHFELLEHDITKKFPKEIIENNNFNIVINLASPASPPHYQRLSIETLMVGSMGTLNMLNIAKKHKSRFFHSSTSEVYGDPEIHPQIESYKGSVNCYGPRSMYDESKRFAEALIYSYRNKYKLSTSIARFFNTYGPGMDINDGRVVSNFITQALENKPLTVYGDGLQTRSFCYVDDLVKGIALLIDSKVEGPINLGNPEEFTVLELADKIIHLTKTKSKLIYKPLPFDDPMQRKPDIEKAQTLLKWKPKIKLEEGLIKTIIYFKKIVSDKTNFN